jgi:hypothetical protein
MARDPVRPSDLEQSEPVRNTTIPPEARLYASAFDAYLRARPDGAEEQQAADRMTATLNVLAQARLSAEPVRAHVGKLAAAARR